MSDNSSLHENPSDEQLITSWARISLDFGATGIEVAEADEADTHEPTAQLRQEIQDMIGVIRQAAQANSSEKSTDAVMPSDEELTEEIFQRMLADAENNLDIPDAEKSTGGEEGEKQLEVSEDLVSVTDGPSKQDDASAELLDPEIEREILEATSDDVVKALLLASVDRPEILVYEADAKHVDVFVLTVEVEDDEFVTAQLGEDGVLRPGTNFEEFAAELMEELPTRGGLCATQDSYSYSVPVTTLGEELTLDADSEVAALIELEMPDVPALVAQSLTVGPVDVVPADNGWSLISCDPVSMLHILQNLGKPAIVAESTEYSQHLAFVVPGDNGRNEEPTGDWSEWMNRVVGTPVPHDVDAGAIINLVWGPAKKQTRYLPRESFALDTLWLLPGILPEPLNFVQMNDEIENLTWFYGLDETASKRLRNYVESSDSELGMESVLQLLGLPLELSKVAQGRVDMESIPGHRSLAPHMSVAKVVSESVSAFPNGTDAVSQVQRVLRGRPWIFTADGVAQLGASGLLALAATRKLSRGESARVQAALAILLAGSGVSEIAIGRVYSKLKTSDNRALGVEKKVVSDVPSLVEELDTESEKSPQGGKSKIARNLRNLRHKTKEQTRQQLRKFFGEGK